MNHLQEGCSPRLAESRLLIARGAYDEARAKLVQLIRDDPGFTDAINLLLSIESGEMRPERAALRDMKSYYMTRAQRRRYLSEGKAFLSGIVFLIAAAVLFIAGIVISIRGHFIIQSSRAGGYQPLSGRDALIMALGLGIVGAYFYANGVRRERIP